MLMTGDELQEVQELLAERAMTRILLAYCQGVDRRDWALVRECYHEGAVDQHGAYVGDPEGFIAFVSARHENVASSNHLLTNVSVAFNPNNARMARVESYCLSMQIVRPVAGDPFAGDGDEPAFILSMSRYVDLFEKREAAGWRISRRDCVFDWSRRQSTADQLHLDPAWVHSERDRSDILYSPWPG